MLAAEQGLGLADPDSRFLRVRYLRAKIGELRRALGRCRFPCEIVVDRDRLLVRAGGVLLGLEPVMNSTDRYLKLVDGMAANEGEPMLQFLRSRGIEPRRIVDVGANMGEITLYFARWCPGARILAIEPSSDSWPALERNLAAQDFPVDGVTVLREAVSDQAGLVELARGLGTQNSITFSGTSLAKRVKHTETVKCDTLDSILDRHGFGEVDFMKIDIEGAEPLLCGALRQRAESIRAILFEVWRRALPGSYDALVALMFDAGRACFLGGEEGVALARDEVMGRLYQGAALNLWFMRD